MTTTLLHPLSLVRSDHPFSVLDIAAISFAIVLPATLYRALYSITLGYGGSVAALGLVVAVRYPLDQLVTKCLVAATIVYGVRLAVYLWMRDASGWKPATKVATTRFPLQKSIPLALTVSVLYAAMVSPVLYVVENPPNSRLLCWSGTILAWMGVIMEAVADQHKAMIKHKYAVDNKFVGPSQGLYRIVRHPNYLGEILVWLGFWVAGLGSYDKVWSRWLWSTGGLIGIVSIMFGSSQRLETQHQKKYGGQAAYEEWKKQVPAPLIPFRTSVPSQVVPVV